MSTTILVVEDDPAVRQGIVDTLSFSGYEVIAAEDGNQGMEMALSSTYQLMLLDLVLPGHTGFDILERLRTERPGQAVIILSARGEENDRVRGLTLGADDYVMKPFRVRELLARVDAVLRRATERPAALKTAAIGEWRVDFQQSCLLSDSGDRTELSEKEASILRYLLMQQGRIVSRDELFRHVWHIDASRIETRAVDMQVARLRGKLQDKKGGLLQTVRGQGYLISSES